MPKTVQIRNVDDATYERLRSRAAVEGLSLTQYLRRELDRLAGTPTMAEILARADRRREQGGGVSREVLAAAMEAVREERR